MLFGFVLVMTAVVVFRRIVEEESQLGEQWVLLAALIMGGPIAVVGAMVYGAARQQLEQVDPIKGSRWRSRQVTFARHGGAFLVYSAALMLVLCAALTLANVVSGGLVLPWLAILGQTLLSLMFMTIGMAMRRWAATYRDPLQRREQQ
ncbi:MAG: hypothetical protein ACRDWY_14405 [Actinomycetes bacterium]